jgi:hypothetical protein
MLNDNDRSELINILTLALQKYEKYSRGVGCYLLGLCEVLGNLSNENLKLVPLFLERYKKLFPNEVVKEGFYFKYNVATISTNQGGVWINSCPTHAEYLFGDTNFEIWCEPRINFLKDWINELSCRGDILTEISAEIDNLSDHILK